MKTLRFALALLPFAVIACGRPIPATPRATPIAAAVQAPATMATTVATSPLGYRLVYPADWKLVRRGDVEERTATSADGVSLISVAPFPAPITTEELAQQTPFQLFSIDVAPGSTDDPAITWPDGSLYRTFTGTDPVGRPIAGATRIVRLADGTTYALLYATSPDRWPAERAQAEALLAQSGPTPAPMPAPTRPPSSTGTPQP